MVYGEFGKEKDKHLIPLCKFHHEDYHIKNRVKGNMLKTTYNYIKNEKLNLLKTI